MESVLVVNSQPLALLRLRAAAIASSQLQLQLLPLSSRSFLAPLSLSSRRTLGLRRSFALSVSATLTANSTPARSGVYTVGDFMTRKEEMHVVKPTTSVDDGGGLADNNMFPEVDSTWKTFNEVQKLLSKTNGQVIGDLMTPAPVVVRETTNLEDAARLLLETKYRRLPVVDVDGKLVGIITRGNVVRAALQIKRETEQKA
ncbi:CBS domain-containing protein CBSX2, chloroplastic-like isoform X2 [Punica granatum]|uniref:CBS domain-containing protein CBSX2, chloroplastic-like isoform X2 n=1 Tax=Punica granatum TaxID=22663 RepID=A0A6P8D5Z6_PUNGR|nr:CBS domain-containing protein CBSX2, chloroplastic-like isoform X2 [Punica granatum]